jgi:hypothetical protein
LSSVESDPDAVIALNCSPDGTLRNVIPSQDSNSKWVYDLVSITIS